jgi:5-methylcytosine-specific restriction endonuclease McrA
MNIIKTLKFIITSKHSHFLSIDIKTYNKWKFLIKLAVMINKDYKSCEIFRKKFKSLRNFVVVGLKYNGKNVKRRTSGYAKDFIDNHRSAKCIYCSSKLTYENATADHIIPISGGGNNCQVNLIVCCKDCNTERGNIEFNTYLLMKNRGYHNNKKSFI